MINFNKVVKETNIKSFFLFNDISIDDLYGEEKEYLLNYGEVRRQSFANGRYAAKQVLEQLNYTDFPLLINKENNAPLWPDAVKGSISHCDGAAVAIASSAVEYLNLGVDIEDFTRCSQKLWPSIFGAEEINYLNSLEEDVQIKFATLLFSAKESYFKFLNPVLNKWIGFHDVIVKLDASHINFIPKQDFLVKAHNEYEIIGRYDFLSGYVFTYVFAENKS